MIKAILLDAGGVYFQGSFVRFINQSYQVLDISGEFSVDDEITFNNNYNRGKIGIEQCFRETFGVSINDEQMAELIRLWKNTWKPDPQMVDLVRRLKPRYQLAILSNSDLVNSELYKEKGWYDDFDYLFLSHELGVIKPEHVIYGIVIERTGIPGYDWFFADDQVRNLFPARQMGMTTCLFESAQQLQQELRTAGVES